LVVFPNCKINLGLNIVAKRADGFHDLETVFYPIAIKDVLEVVQQSPDSTDVEFTATGLQVAGTATDNLCVKAYHLLQKDFPSLPSIKMHLHKVIPMGAGLGGGSSDGAFTLGLLNRKFQLNLPADQLIDYALQLGSDCPFFIFNTPCFAEGRGEKLEPIHVDLSGYCIVVIYPGIHVNTGWAFSQVRPTRPQRQMRDIIHQPIITWKDELANDFEEAVFDAHPQIKAIKENLYAHGAVYASMSGSGSTVYGILEKGADTRPFTTGRYQTFVL
jgi:4-diphosphocytidyl-2-C-methyl-D-erythritol kinase